MLVVTGTELIRRKDGGEAFAFTCPLIAKADGTKFGKTEKGNVWLDPNKTSVYDFYQFWIRASDADAEKWIKIFTFLDKTTVDSLLSEHKKDESKRILQKRLAEEVTRLVHGEDELKKAILTTEKAFENLEAPAESLSIEDIEALNGLEKIDFSKEKINAGIDIVSFLAESGIFPSKGEARKTIQGGGIQVNRKKIDNIQHQINSSLLLHHKYILVKKGKKNNYLVSCN